MMSPRVLSENEVAELFRVSSANKRDNMLIKALYYLGLKNGEAQNLKVGDVELPAMTIKVARGRRTRHVPIPEGFSEDMKQWLEHCQDYVFRGRDSKRRLSDRHIRRLVKKWAKEAGIADCNVIKPHTLRVSYAVHLRKNETPVADIQKLLGHARKETTEMYTYTIQ